jgi:hypothetical protein
MVGGRGFLTSGSGGGYGCSGSGYGGVAAGCAGISTTAAAISVSAGGDVGGGGRGDGDGGAVGVDDITTTVVVVSVGYNYGVCGAIGSVAVGPPEHSQHNIRATRCCRLFDDGGESPTVSGGGRTLTRRQRDIVKIV